MISAIIFCLTALILCDVTHAGCPEGTFAYTLDKMSIEDMLAQAANVPDDPDDGNIDDPKPIFRVEFLPNNENYDNNQALDGFARSNTFINGTGWDAYHITANERNFFYLNGIRVSTRFCRNVAVDFYTRPNDKALRKTGFDVFKIPRGLQKVLTLASFPNKKSNATLYETMPIGKIRIAFRIKAGKGNFLAQNLRVFTCIPSLVV